MEAVNRIIVLLFCGFLTVMGLLTVLSPDRPFSEAENRPLQQLPEFTAERLFSGAYTRDLETYVKDQFIGKRLWTGVKAVAQKAQLQKDNNGIYFGKDHYLLEPFREPDGQLVKNSELLADFAKRIPEADTYALLAPTSVGIYPEKLPLFARTADEAAAIRAAERVAGGAVSWIDALQPLRQEKDRPVYYRTDHHWTAHGAYAAYRAAGKQLGYEPIPEERFTIRTVSDSFRGTFDAKANDPTVPSEPLDIYEPKFDMDYEVTDEDGELRLSSLYDWRFLDKRDKYSLFLGGNHRAVTIHSSVDNGRKLMILKDSYAHSLVPFLANHYEEIYMVDLRYDHRDMAKVLNRKGIKEVLVVYNIATFAEDENLIWLRPH